MKALSKQASWTNSLVVWALIVILVWYWQPHWTKAFTTELPPQPVGAVRVSILPPETAVEHTEQQAADPESEPEAGANPESESTTQEVADYAETPPKEVQAEGPPEKEVAEAEIAATEDGQPGSDSEVAESVAQLLGSEENPSESIIASAGTTIAGRAVDLFSFMEWLDQEGGVVWMDQGNMEVDNLYQLDSSGQVIPVSRDSYRQASAHYVPRLLSNKNRKLIKNWLGSNIEKDQRLMFLWPKAIWFDIQDRVNALQLERVQMEYHIVGSRLQLHVVTAMRQGKAIPELIGLLP